MRISDPPSTGPRPYRESRGALGAGNSMGGEACACRPCRRFGESDRHVAGCPIPANRICPRQTPLDKASAVMVTWISNPQKGERNMRSKHRVE